MNNVLFNNHVMGPGVIPRRRRPRVYRHRPSQLLDVYTDEEIRDRYRFRRNSIAYICDLVDADLRRPTIRNHALSVETQVLTSLRYLASGCFYQVDADIMGIDKSSVSRVVHGFCKAIVAKGNQFIRFPRTDDEKSQNKIKFFQMGGFPSCIGAIDGFHVRICTPHEDENDYVNRKGWHSINCQAIIDADLKFVNAVARWPGGTHDSFVLQTSRVYDHLEANHTLLDHGVLVGDSGYPLKPYLMVPYDNPLTRSQRRFNATLKTTRSSVERAIGQLKRRFNCLHQGLRVQPKKACTFITACIILHNIAKMLNEEDFDGDDEDGFECDPLPLDYDASQGSVVRDHIASTFFPS